MWNKERREQIAKQVAQEIVEKYRHYELNELEITHYGEGAKGYAIVHVISSFYGEQKAFLTERRHFVVGKRGQLKLLNGKFRSDKKTIGRHNVVWSEVY